MRTDGLNQGSASPLYKQLIHKLRSDIATGIYPAHSRFPTELELCATYGVSRVTIRKALSVLEQEGLLERHQGRGTFVCTPRIHKDLRNVNSFSETCRIMGITPGTQVIASQLVPAEEEDCLRLLCQPDAQVVKLVRLRLADDVPVMLEVNRFPAAYAWLLECDLSAPLYALLREHGIEPGQASHEVSLCYAGAHEARLLAIAPGCALLALNETIYDASGHPLHTSRQHIRGDRFTFRI